MDYGQLAPFGYKATWLAIRDGDPTAIAGQLGLGEPKQIPANEAVDQAASGHPAALTGLPGVGGTWTLVITPDPMLEEIAKLSSELGSEVQYFGTHRVSESHEWGLARDGVLLREFSLADGSLERWSGSPTPAELSLGLPDTGQPDDPQVDVILFGANSVDEDFVMRLAGAWSVNPMELVGPAPGPAFGFHPAQTEQQLRTQQQSPDRKGLLGKIFGR